MRMLFATDVPLDRDAGVSGAEYETIEALRRRGHVVDAIWADDLPHRIKHGNMHCLFELPAALRQEIARRCSNQSYDILSVSHPQSFAAAREHRRFRRPGVFVHRTYGWELMVREQLRPWRKALGVPETTFWRSLPSRLVQQGLAWQCRQALRHADAFLTSCGDCRDYLVDRHGIASCRVGCVPLAPSEPFRTVLPVPMTAERLKRILYVGQFAFYKGPHILGGVINQVLKVRRDMGFTWVLPEKDHRLAKALLDPDVMPRVDLIGRVDVMALVGLYDSHGIFVFPSLHEGFGKAFIEAMSRGLCVVASELGGMADVIVPERDGVLIPVGDVSACVRSVLLLADQRPIAYAMSKAARVRASQYTWERTAQEIEEFFARLLSPDAILE